MNEQPARSESTQSPVSWQRPLYQQPTVEWISLNCEISAYAPDEGDVPLF